jgi:predicted dehydrogenase
LCRHFGPEAYPDRLVAARYAERQGAGNARRDGGHRSHRLFARADLETEPARIAAQKGYENFIDRFTPAYRAEIAGFPAAVESGAESPCGVFDARRALAIALAADRSLREHRPVRLEEIG